MEKLPCRVDLLHEQYYNLNVLSLWMIGLVPEKSTWLMWMKNTCLIVILTAGLTFEVASFVHYNFPLKDILNDVSMLIVTFGCAVKYLICLCQRDTVDTVFNKMRSHWARIESKKELDIYMKYARCGKFHTMMILLTIFLMMLIVTFGQYMPIFLDVIVPLNNSRPRQLLTAAYFFFDTERYFHAAVLITNLVIIIICLVYASTECFTITYLQHACGLFEVARYRLAEASSINVGKKSSEAAICWAIKRAVAKHNIAYEFGDYLQEKFAPTYLFLLALGIVSLALGLYRLSQCIVAYHGITDLLASGFLSCGIFCYIFYLNYMSQQAINECSNIFVAIYDTEWYKIPVSAQKLLLFIRLKSIKQLLISCFGIYNVSMEGFAAIVRLSLSYFMMLHSLTQ